MTVFFYLTIALFCLGLLGIFMKKDLVSVLLSLEMVLGAVFLLLVVFSRHVGDIQGQVQALLVCMVMVAQFIVGVSAVLLLFYSRTTTKGGESLNSLE